ncbi:MULTISPECIES: DUF2157 domain-containing protein [Trichocoleus]|uniref:DUF2157 domain-containing protein n=1 Tax=Trichocoleus desertorum GB2-A4 TaxID=2933944 RepID=A0ABV0JGF4_9CYAN|nr:DUF2157 domain-containing protein [Trichocoleus sp. FACHB-46]MBD1862741.1 DUF2157 domain-containing protein [Trichocoleus sp. FACHB-46]
MPSDKFRYQLRQEAEYWRRDGLIDATQYQQIAERYQFNTLETAARNRFTLVLIGLGSILVGLAVITFVAANWQEWPRSVKMTLLLSLFVGVNTAGFYLWRQRYTFGTERWQQRLGQGLLLLGTLVLGANLALMAQMFQVNGPSHELYLVWGLGVMAMAYSLRLTSLGVVAILLLGLGYWQAFFNWGTLELGSIWLRWFLQYMPLCIALLTVPLAYWCRSRVIFALGAIAVISAFEGNLSVLGLNYDRLIAETPWLSAIAFALPPALLWAYDDTFWAEGGQHRLSNLETHRPFHWLARSLALLFLSVLLYWLSFHGFWDGQVTYYPTTIPETFNALWANVTVLLGLTLLEWLYLARQAKGRSPRRPLELSTPVMASFIGILAGLPFLPQGGEFMPAIATFTVNVLLFLLGAGLIREGIASGQRRNFWLGMTLFVLQTLSRLFEYSTSLVFKSFVLLLCGLGVIAIGLWYERYIRTLSTHSRLSVTPNPTEGEN